MDLKASCLFCTYLILGLAPQPLLAQTAPTPNNRELVKQFRDGFMQGCQTGKTPGVSNQMRYCTCLANSYQARYDGKTLATISQLATASVANGSRIVNLMMSPEAKTCAAKS